MSNLNYHTLWSLSQSLVGKKIKSGEIEGKTLFCLGGLNQVFLVIWNSTSKLCCIDMETKDTIKVIE